MKLTPLHIEALLNELEKAQQDEGTSLAIIHKEQLNNLGTPQYFEVSHFLAQQRIELIKQSLIANEIDY